MKKNSNLTHHSIVYSHRRWILFVLSTIVITCIGSQFVIWRSPATAQPAPKRGPLIVRGYIATDIAGRIDTPGIAVPQLLPRDVYLPGIVVFLRNLSGGDDSKPNTTDLSGRFTLLAPKPGRYNVCWKSKGFQDGCGKDIISVTAPVFLNGAHPAGSPGQGYCDFRQGEDEGRNASAPARTAGKRELLRTRRVA